MKNFCDLADLCPEQIEELLNKAKWLEQQKSVSDLRGKVLALLFLSGAVSAQLTPITLGQLEPDAVTQDFNGDPDGPIGSMAAAFAAIYLTNVRLVGTFNPTGDDLDNSPGDNSLCSRNNVLTISTPTNLTAGN